jgi:hypothetical protein
MITPMQKVTVLCLDTGRDSALQSLRELGVMHLIFDRRAEHEISRLRAAISNTSGVLVRSCPSCHSSPLPGYLRAKLSMSCRG